MHLVIDLSIAVAAGVALGVALPGVQVLARSKRDT
jgi:hypothetical protein